MQINQLNVLVIKIQNIGVRVTALYHTHGAFLTHAQAMAIPPANKQHTVFARRLYAEEG